MMFITTMIVAYLIANRITADSVNIHFVQNSWSHSEIVGVNAM